jgi:hypothetical protein
MSTELKMALIRLVEDMSKNTGMDLDGDIITYNSKRYYVNCMTKEIEEVI